MGAHNLESSRRLYEYFANACQEADWEAYVPHQNTDPQNNAYISDRSVLSQDMTALESSNAMVVYLGEPSLGVGAEIVLAMQQQIPIFALYESSRSVSRFVVGLLESYPKATVFQYANVDEARESIMHSLGKISKNRGVYSA